VHAHIWNKLRKHKVFQDGHLAPHMGQDAHAMGILPQLYNFIIFVKYIQTTYYKFYWRHISCSSIF